MQYIEDYFKVEQKESWLYSIKDQMEVYCWLLIGEDSAILFDTGYGIGDLPGTIREITDKPLTVVLSHGHADHVLGAGQFEKVLLHRADFDVYKEYSGSKWRQKTIDAINKNKDKLRFWVDRFDFEAYLEAGPGNLEVLDENVEFDLGGLTVQTVPMQGHTPGSVGLHVPGFDVLFTGDAANRACFMFLPESLALTEYLEMLKRVKLLNFNTHFTGHQDKAYSKSWFDKYIKVAENALKGKGKPMNIPGAEEYGEILVSKTGGPIISPTFCAVGYTKNKLSATQFE